MFETDLPFKGSKWSNAYPLKDAGGGEAWVTFQDNTISLYSSGDSDKADVAGRSIRIKVYSILLLLRFKPFEALIISPHACQS